MTRPEPGPLPTLAIVIPLKEARTSDPLEGVRAWVERQTCSRDRYQVIVAANGDHPEWERQARALLRPPDLFLRPEPRRGTFALLDAGARASRGRWVHFAELHTVPDATCAEEILAYVDKPEVAAATVESRPRGSSRVARAERQVFEAVAKILRTPGRPPSAALRGVTVRRDVFEKVGGMPGGYGLFAEEIFSARLHAAGVTVGHADRARIVHVERNSLRGHRWDVAFFTWGEMTYRAANDPAFCERYFGRPLEWADRDGYRPELARLRARAARRALVRGLARRNGRDPARALGVLGAEWLRHVTRRRLGARGEMVAAWLATALAEARFVAWGPDGRRGFRAYEDATRRYTRCVRLWCVDRHVRSTRLPPPSGRPDPDGAMPREADLLGFHAGETFEGATFRWTDVCAVVRLDIEPGDYTVRLVTGGLRKDLPRLPVTLALNDRPVPPSEIRLSPDAICFPIDRAAFVPGPDQRLTLVCPPLEIPPSSPETRRLGVPIFRIEFHARR